MSIKKETIDKYVRHLTNLGCVFKIIEDDGIEHGTLEVMRAAPTKPRIQVLRNIDYKTVIDTLKVGDVVELTAPDDVPVESLRSAVSSYSSLRLGNGKITTSVNRKTGKLEIMRLEE